MIAQGFKKVYSGPQFGLNHICLFALSGIISVISLMFQNTSKAKASPDFSLLIIGAVLLFAISIYLGGYTYKYMHNCFYPEKESYLPDFDGEPFALFFKALPLVFAWGLYFFLIALICLIIKALIIPAIILFLIITPFISFIFVAFSKNFDTSGLFNPILPFKFFPQAFGDIVVLGLCFIPLWIAASIPSVISGVIMGISGTGTETNSYILYAAGILGGYIGLIFQFVWNYCLVQIYKDKLENIVE